MTDHDELIDQGPFLLATGNGFQLEDDMHEYDHVMSTDPRLKAAQATGDRWSGLDAGLERFHDQNIAGIWAMVAGVVMVVVGLIVLRYS